MLWVRKHCIAELEGHNANAFGQQALYSLTTGSDNAAFGTYALHQLTTYSSNTAVGNFAMRYATRSC